MMPKTYRRGAGTRLVDFGFRTLTRLALGRKDRHLLTVRGRKTGRPLSTPVDVIEEGGARWLVAAYGVTGWVRNVRVHGEVTIARGGRSEGLRAVEVGPLEGVPVLRRYLQEVPVTRPYFTVTSASTDQEFAADLQRHPVFRLDPR